MNETLPFLAPEYPRPRLVRDRWQDLNGTWEFAFDPDDRGLAEDWVGHPFESRIVVPFAHQWPASGRDDRRICEVVWYARDFDLPGDWNADTVLLHFSAVDYEATVWLNGEEVGFHRGGHVPFAMHMGPGLREHGNRLVARVVDRQDPGQPRGKQATSGKPHGIDYRCTTGIWGSVWLEPVGQTHVGDLVVRTDPESEQMFAEVVVYGARGDVEARVELYDEGRLVSQAIDATFLEPARLSVPEPKLWTPDSPFLYGLRVTLWRGQTMLDEVRSYAGMRSLRLEGGRFLLNGAPIVLRLVLDQGYWPETGLTPPDDHALRADVEWIKRLGFNGARKHQKIEDSRWLAWCDRLGLLVWDEMPSARAWSHETQDRLEAEWMEAVMRDRSHPCVVAWVPLNESMGYDGLASGHPAQRHGVNRLVHLTRRLDPTRPVIDNDGWEQGASSDVVAIHDYSHTGAELALRYPGGQIPPRIWSGSRVSLLPGVEVAGRPIVLTEVGGFLTRPEGPEAGWDSMYRVYDSVATGRELQDKVVELMAGIGSLPFIAGFCYTQLTDVEQELNGLLTSDRRPKVHVEAVAAAIRAVGAPSPGDHAPGTSTASPLSNSL